jgi:hypothetical protein
MKIISILVIVLLSTNAFLGAVTNDEAQIQNASILVLGGKGHMHILPPAEESFWRLYSTSNAAIRFQTLMSKSTTAGKAYCIVGLFYLDVETGDYHTGYTLSLFIELLEKQTFKRVFEQNDN